MDNARTGILHVSQNIPTRSNLEVSMRRPTSIQVHVSAIGPRFSSLSWRLDGDPKKNEIAVEQRIPDKDSKLSCQPSCLKKGKSLANNLSMPQRKIKKRKNNRVKTISNRKQTRNKTNKKRLTSRF